MILPESLRRTRKAPRLSAATLAVLGVAGLLSACAEREVILQGQREDPRSVMSADGPAVVGDSAPTTAALRLPAVRGNAEWPNRGGSSAHTAGNVALAGGTSRIWSANVGQPAGLRHRITADPIVGGGLIYTLDSRARVTATTTGGGTAWSTDLTPPMEHGDSASGGGIAYEAGRVFVTTQYGELVALDSRSGGVLWRQKVGAAISGAPTVARGTVYVAARDATGWAIRAEDGKTLWTTAGLGDVAGWMGVSAPAVDGDLVVFPSASGQLVAADAATGQTRWTATVAGRRAGRAITAIRDMTGDPVITGNMVIAGTSAGRIAAFDRSTGTELWSAREGAMSPVLAAGNALFAVSDDSQLVRLDIANGGRVWAVPLPEFTDNRARKQAGVWAHFGPILASGRLLLASGDGYLRVINPANGSLIGSAAIPGGASTAPVVAGQTLYVTGRNGQLHAFR